MTQIIFDREKVIDYYLQHPELSPVMRVGLIKSIQVLYNIDLTKAIILYRKYFG